MCGKVLWAKLPQIQSNEGFAGKLSRCLAFKILEQLHYTKLIPYKQKYWRTLYWQFAQKTLLAGF